MSALTSFIKNQVDGLVDEKSNLSNKYYQQANNYSTIVQSKDLFV